MGMHCPTCSCSQCQIQENRYPEITGDVTYIDRNGNRYQDGKYVGHQSEIDTSNDWINERNISDRPRQEKIIWRKGQPNYPGSYEGSQVISHVTQGNNSQTFYVDRSLPPQSIRGFQQTYHQDPNQRWERMPDSPLPEEMQRQVNRQMHGLAEQLRQQYGAQNVQVHQAFIIPDQLTPELIRQLPPEQQQQIRQYQQQLSRQGQPYSLDKESYSLDKNKNALPARQQPKQGFWDRLRGKQSEQTLRSLNQHHLLTSQQKQQIINICKKYPLQEVGGIIDSKGRVIQLPNLAQDKRNHFAFRWNGQDAVAIWHQHCQKLGHSPELSPDDIAAANQSGLSMYAIYNPTWQIAEYHPANRKIQRNYSVSFTCPTAQQLMQQQKQAVEWMQQDNQRLRQKITEAGNEIKAKQQEVLATVTRTLTTTNNIQAKSDAIALRLKMAGTQPKLLPPGQGDKADGTIRTGQQSKQREPIHAGQRNNSDAKPQHRDYCLPVGRGTPAESARDRRVAEKSWMD